MRFIGMDVFRMGAKATPERLRHNIWSPSWQALKSPHIVGLFCPSSRSLLTLVRSAGLIAITPGAGFIDVTGAVVSGTGAGALCYWTCQLKYLLSFDDALDSFGIHGPAAIWGGMLVGFFAQKEIGGTDGCFYGNCRQLAKTLN
jgi:hypothetical protein